MTASTSPSDQLVLAADDGPVRTLTLNRPTRLNAFTSASYRRLAQLLHDAAENPAVLVVVLRGQGRAFCSGVDLEELGVEGGQGGQELGETFDALVKELLGFAKPLVAAVHGPAVGFGATILLHCDVVLVADDARLRFPFTSLSTAPEAGSSALLPAIVGPRPRRRALLHVALDRRRRSGALRARPVAVSARAPRHRGPWLGRPHRAAAWGSGRLNEAIASGRSHADGQRGEPAGTSRGRLAQLQVRSSRVCGSTSSLRSRVRTWGCCKSAAVRSTPPPCAPWPSCGRRRPSRHAARRLT